MWNSVLDLIYNAVVSAFGWFQQILDAAPGAWSTIFTMFVILALSRFLLGPLLGVSFGVSSDTVQAHKNKAEWRRQTRESYNEWQSSKGG